MKIDYKIEGIEDVNRTLSEIAPKDALAIMRSTVHDMAGELRKEARKNAPTDGPPLTLRPAIKTKRRRMKYGWVQSDVIVERRAYFWKFLEYGDGPDKVKHAFFLRALRWMEPQVSAIYLKSFMKKLEARLKRQRK